MPTPAYGRLHGRYLVGSDAIATAYRRINALEVVTATPLLLWLNTRPADRLSPQDPVTAISAIESWLMRGSW